MEIEVERIRVEVVSRGDMRGVLRVADVDLPVDTGITLTVQLETRGATEERLAKLREIAEAASGVLGMLRYPIPLAVTWS
jgi:hypothetical protein